MGDDEKVKNEAFQIIGQHQNLPTLVVFDLDYTLWPFYCECCDEDEMPYLYPQASAILYALKDKAISMAVASRSPTPDIAKSFLQTLGIHSLFVTQVCGDPFNCFFLFLFPLLIQFQLQCFYIMHGFFIGFQLHLVFLL